MPQRAAANSQFYATVRFSILESKSGELFWCGADVPAREAFGVRPACWRYRQACALRKREQAPRTPNASRYPNAHLPLRQRIYGRPHLAVIIQCYYR